MNVTFDSRLSRSPALLVRLIASGRACVRALHASPPTLNRFARWVVRRRRRAAERVYRLSSAHPFQGRAEHAQFMERIAPLS